MKASSESGLCALTISREATEVIRGNDPSSYNSRRQLTEQAGDRPTGPCTEGDDFGRFLWKLSARTARIPMTPSCSTARDPRRSALAQSLLSATCWKTSRR